MSNTVLFGQDARNKLKAGIDVVAKAVGSTLGASGRNGAYNKWTRVPIISNDGVSLAREIEPEDLGELQGANLLKQVSERTDEVAGDGTTTSIVLAHSMITQGIEMLNDVSKNVNPMKLRREIIEASKKVVNALETSAIKTDDSIKLAEIATVSVESPEIGQTITDTILNAGDDGIVYVNDSDKIGVSAEKVDGYQIPAGLISPGMVTDLDRMEAVLNNPVVLVTDIQVHLNEDFLRFLGEVTKVNKEILLICNEFHPDVLKFAIANKVKGNFKMAIVKKPMQIDYLEDVAALTGGFAMTDEKGKLQYKVEYLGSAKKIVVKQFTTTIIGGAGLTGVKMIDGTMTVDGKTYIETLKKQYENSDNEIIKTKLKERIARLTENVYMLNVGDRTEAEQKYLRMKVDDAVNAVKAAREEGIVAGGGIALFQIAKDFLEPNEGITYGEKVVYNACFEPLRKIVENSGEDYEAIVATRVGKEAGFNALTLNMESNMIGAGIIDPVKVTKSAFTNAANFAALFLTIEFQVIPNPEVNTVLPR